MPIIKIAFGHLVLFCVFAAVTAPPKEPPTKKQPTATSEEAKTVGEQPALPQSTVRDLLKAVEQCKDEVHSNHDADLACKDFPENKKFSDEEIKKMSPEDRLCNRLRDNKQGKGKPVPDAELKDNQVSKKSNDLLGQMQKAIENGFTEHYGCKPAVRTFHTLMRVASPLAKGTFDPKWMTDCFRPKIQLIVKDDQEFINVFGQNNEVSDDSLRALIRALACPTNRIDLDAANPWKALESLPTSVKQQLNEFFPKIKAYMVCFWDIKFKEKATFRQVFDCEDDGKFYKKAVACANPANGKKLDEGFDIKFPATLNDYHLGRNGEGPQSNRATSVEAKPGIVTRLLSWGFDKMCSIAGKLDEKIAGKGDIGTPKLDELPQLETKARRRKRYYTVQERADILSYTAAFTVLVSMIAGGTAGGIKGGAAGGAGAGCGAGLGIFTGFLGGCILASIVIGVVNEGMLAANRHEVRH